VLVEPVTDVYAEVQHPNRLPQLTERRRPSDHDGKRPPLTHTRIEDDGRTVLDRERMKANLSVEGRELANRVTAPR
jgi:hypothetical protein